MQDPPAADRESFFKPLFLTEALRPPKNPQKTGEFIYYMLIQGGAVIYSKPPSFCGFAHYGVGMSLGGHAFIGLWSNTQEAASIHMSCLLAS
jgi:hypothetical protein